MEKLIATYFLHVAAALIVVLVSVLVIDTP
jgi:hypothetical protein